MISNQREYIALATSTFDPGKGKQIGGDTARISILGLGSTVRCYFQEQPQIRNAKSNPINRNEKKIILI